MITLPFIALNAIITLLAVFICVSIYYRAKYRKIKYLYGNKDQLSRLDIMESEEFAKFKLWKNVNAKMISDNEWMVAGRQDILTYEQLYSHYLKHPEFNSLSEFVELKNRRIIMTKII